MKRKISTYKLHELRMWIIQIIIPGILGFVMLRSNPQIKAWMDKQWEKFKHGIRKVWGKLKTKFGKN